MITAKQVRRHLRYDHKTGLLWWKLRGPHRTIQYPAGTLCAGRWYIGLFGKHFIAHRLAWLIKTGGWPQTLDHINGNPLDNRWCNLREATPSQNCANAKRYKNNTSGFKGVSWVPRDQKYAAYFSKDGKRFGLGYYNTPEQAHTAYIAAAKKHFGEFARAS